MTTISFNIEETGTSATLTIENITEPGWHTISISKLGEGGDTDMSSMNTALSVYNSMVSRPIGVSPESAPQTQAAVAGGEQGLTMFKPIFGSSCKYKINYQKLSNKSPENGVITISVSGTFIVDEKKCEFTISPASSPVEENKECNTSIAIEIVLDNDCEKYIDSVTISNLELYKHGFLSSEKVGLIVANNEPYTFKGYINPRLHDLQGSISLKYNSGNIASANITIDDDGKFESGILKMLYDSNWPKSGITADIQIDVKCIGGAGSNKSLQCGQIRIIPEDGACDTIKINSMKSEHGGYPSDKMPIGLSYPRRYILTGENLNFISSISIGSARVSIKTKSADTMIISVTAPKDKGSAKTYDIKFNANINGVQCNNRDSGFDFTFEVAPECCPNITNFSIDSEKDSNLNLIISYVITAKKSPPDNCKSCDSEHSMEMNLFTQSTIPTQVHKETFTMRITSENGNQDSYTSSFTITNRDLLKTIACSGGKLSGSIISNQILCCAEFDREGDTIQRKLISKNFDVDYKMVAQCSTATITENYRDSIQVRLKYIITKFPDHILNVRRYATCVGGSVMQKTSEYDYYTVSNGEDKVESYDDWKSFINSHPVSSCTSSKYDCYVLVYDQTDDCLPCGELKNYIAKYKVFTVDLLGE